MNDPLPSAPSSAQTQTVFQKATGEVLAQRIEALALEIRGIGNADALTLASTETLSALAMTLKIILKRIDDIFELEAFVFTPACMILLELFQARARGSVISTSILCQVLSCNSNVTLRWIDFLHSRNLIEKLESSTQDVKICLTEKGYLKSAQALQLLL